MLMVVIFCGDYVLVLVQDYVIVFFKVYDFQYIGVEVCCDVVVKYYFVFFIYLFCSQGVYYGMVVEIGGISSQVIFFYIVIGVE